MKSGCEIVEKGLLALLLQTRIPLSVQPALKVCFGLNPSKHSPQPHNTHTQINRRQFFPLDFPHSSVGKESACNAGDPGSIPGSGRSSRERIGYLLQYSGLENSMDHIVHGITKSWTRLSDFCFSSSLSCHISVDMVYIVFLLA